MGLRPDCLEKSKLLYKPGDFYQGADYQLHRMGETIGRIKAIDVANKKVVWEVKSPLPLFSGMLVTKGGVLFTGDLRGRFLAYDAKSGKELWKYQTGSGINASPITYELDGKQYVAILSDLGVTRPSIIQRRRAGCFGCSPSTVKSTKATCTIPRSSRRCCGRIVTERCACDEASRGCASGIRSSSLHPPPRSYALRFVAAGGRECRGGPD